MSNNWLRKNISGRKLLDKGEKEVSYIQIIGFILIALGVSSLFFPTIEPKGSFPVSFFIIMLGMALAFPSLLKGPDNDFSTMRIVVFMMVNVICILLLKIGVKDNVKSLKDIGLDQYWMGVIAFIFGAKATQSFFESKMAALSTGRSGSDDTSKSAPENNDTADLPNATVEDITKALKANGKEWVNSFPFVTGFSVRNKTVAGKEIGTPALVFKVTKKSLPSEFGKIPPFLTFRLDNGKLCKIPTDVVEEDIPQASSGFKFNDPPFPAGNSISRKNCLTGTLGLVVRNGNDPEHDYIISCYHVFCETELRQNNKSFTNDDGSAQVSCASTNDNGTNLIGAVVSGLMDDSNDFAVARIRKGVLVDAGMRTLNKIPTSFGFVFPENKGDTVRLCGTNSGIKQGKIKSHSASQTVSYFGGTITQFYQGLIEVDPFSVGGDSGALVLNNKDKIIGLVIAGNPSSSYVLPVKDYLLDNNYALKTT